MLSIYDELQLLNDKLIESEALARMRARGIVDALTLREVDRIYEWHIALREKQGRTARSGFSPSSVTGLGGQARLRWPERLKSYWASLTNV